jgi:hypothetical protein
MELSHWEANSVSATQEISCLSLYSVKAYYNVHKNPIFSLIFKLDERRQQPVTLLF